MAKKVIWSETAQKDRKEIFTYWNNRNKSTAYSRKLNARFTRAIKQVSKFPGIGKRIDFQETRMKMVNDYAIVYKEFKAFIAIITIWDSRRDPGDLFRFMTD